MEHLFGHPNESKLPLGEQLYTPRGSQGAGAMLYFLRRYGVLSELGTDHLENDERGIILFRLKLQSEMDTMVYLLRAVWFLDGAPGFNMVGATGRRTSRQDQLISLPMYAKYARIRVK